MIFFGHLFEFRDVHQFRELIEMEHGFVLAVFAKESHVLAEVHIFEMVGYEAAITTLYPLPKIFKDLSFFVRHFNAGHYQLKRTTSRLRVSRFR